MTPLMSFWCFYFSFWTCFTKCFGVFMIDIKQVIVGWESSICQNSRVLTVSEAVVQRCSVKKVCLEILQNPQENTRRPATLLKKRLWHRCFPVNFVKFLRTPFFIEHLWWLLLMFQNIFHSAYINGY